MDLVAFADELRRQIVADMRRFRAAHPEETPYAYALLGGQSPSLGSVVATEEGLQRVAAKYVKLGWRYGNVVEPTPLTAELLAAWLRWANPDDGWYFWGLPDHEQVQAALAALIGAGGLGRGGAELEEFSTGVLASLQDMPEWREEMARGTVIVGFTHGEDPRDFLRTATRANPYPVVRRLWAETWKAEEVGRRIRSPYDRRGEPGPPADRPRDGGSPGSTAAPA
jgi:hypothetical protein